MFLLISDSILLPGLKNEMLIHSIKNVKDRRRLSKGNNKILQRSAEDCCVKTSFYYLICINENVIYKKSPQADSLSFQIFRKINACGYHIVLHVH